MNTEKRDLELLNNKEVLMPRMYSFEETRELIQQAKREALAELRKDAKDHLDSSETKEFATFWLQVCTWLDEPYLDQQLARMEGE